MNFSTKKKLIRRINRFKSNIQYIILIPTILGGLWQLLELSSISISFIRFFSVSQLIADGLLILFVLSIIYLSVKYAKYMSSSEFDEASYEDETLASLIRSTIWEIMILAVVCAALIIAYYKFFSDKDISISRMSTVIAITLIVINRFIYGFKFVRYAKGVLNELKEQDKKGEEEEEITKKPKWLFFTLLGVGIPIILATLYFSIVLGISTIQNFRNQYFLPKELNNLNNLECYFEKNFTLTTKEWEIIYFNDQYIFVELKTPNKNRKYQIVDFDILLDYSQCEVQSISSQEKECSTKFVNDSTNQIEIQTDSVIPKKIDTTLSKEYTFNYKD